MGKRYAMGFLKTKYKHRDAGVVAVGWGGTDFEIDMGEEPESETTEIGRGEEATSPKAKEELSGEEKEDAAKKSTGSKRTREECGDIDMGRRTEKRPSKQEEGEEKEIKEGVGQTIEFDGAIEEAELVERWLGGSRMQEENIQLLKRS